MRGIDLYKAILDGETKYEGEIFRYDDGYNKQDVIINSSRILKSGYSIFSYSTTIINDFMKAELTEIQQPIPWQECIQKWAENTDKYCIRITDGEDVYENSNGRDLLEVVRNEILCGKWYLIER